MMGSYKNKGKIRYSVRCLQCGKMFKPAQKSTRRCHYCIWGEN